MEPWEVLGRRVETEWSSKNYEETVLPDIAERALREAKLHELVSPDDLVRWAIEVDRLPRQYDLEAKFGEPPLTLYAGRGFHVDALFWLDGTTSVHGHGFSGAFAVLAGSSIHTRYRFLEKHRINSFVRIGALDVLEVELLHRGDCRAIPTRPSGHELIHALFHLEHPSVSIVIRTIGDKDAQPQFRYLPPALAIAVGDHIDETQRRRLQIINMARELGGELYERTMVELLSREDYMTSVLALEIAASHLDSDERLAPFIDVVRRRHGHLAEVLPAVLAEARRIVELVEMRKLATSRDHRFLLALLLNLSDRTDVVRMVREHSPERDPIDVILRWMKEMSAEDILGIDFDETSLAMLRCILKELSFDEAMLRFIEQFGASGVEPQRQALREMYDDLVALDRLRPLVTDRRLPSLNRSEGSLEQEG